MNATEVLAAIERAGVRLRAQDGNIIASPKEAVSEEVKKLILSHKAALLNAIPVAHVAHVARPMGDGPRREADGRRERVLSLLRASTGARFALVVEDETTDPVTVAVAIREPRRFISFDVEIPKAKFDGLRLLELAEKHCGLPFINGGAVTVISGAKTTSSGQESVVDTGGVAA